MELGDRPASGIARRRCQLNRAPAGLALGRVKLMTACGTDRPSVVPGGTFPVAKSRRRGFYPLPTDDSVIIVNEVRDPAMVLKNRQYRHKEIPSEIKTFSSITIPCGPFSAGAGKNDLTVSAKTRTRPEAHTVRLLRLATKTAIGDERQFLIDQSVAAPCR